MTIVGHALTGMAIAVALAPRRLGAAGWAAVLAVGVLAGNMPDVPLPSGGYQRYEISHSVFVFAAIMLALTGVLLLWPRGKLEFRGRLAGMIALAWMSNLVLGCCDKPGRGLPIFWPFAWKLALPLRWFPTLPDGGGLWDPRMLQAALTDVEFSGPILLLAVACRLLGGWRARRAAAGSAPEPAAPQVL